MDCITPKVKPTPFIYVLNETSRGASQTLLAKLLVKWIWFLS